MTGLHLPRTEDLPLGAPIPAYTPHAVSVSLPRWEDNVDYEEGRERVVAAMKSGYPRFKIHPDCAALFTTLAARYGWPVEAGDAATSMAFPNRAAAERCVEFVVARDVDAASVRLEALRLVPQQPGAEAAGRGMLDAPVDVYTVLFPAAAAPIAKQFWQHTGEGISSRLASHILEILRSADTASIGVNTSASSNTSANVSSNVSANTNTSANASANTSASAGPAPPATRRPGYHRRPTVAAAAASSTSSATSTASASTPSQTSPQTSSQTVSPHAAAQQPDASSDVGTFIEERFGRNISIGLAEDAKLAIRRRIAGIIGRADGQHDEQQLRGAGVSERDVWLYPCGMNAIYHAHRILKRALGDRSAARGVVFGFVYTDTLKVLEKFGPQPAAGNSAMFFGHGDGADYDALEAALAAERVLAIFTECPSNPLLKTADLARLRRIADANGCALVVDETLGNFSNINVLPYADVVVSSLTKVFSGDSNVMGGSLVVNPRSVHADAIRAALRADFDDTVWCEDAIFLERNSRTFVERCHAIDANTEAVCELLLAHPLVEKLYYPKYITTDNYHMLCRNPAQPGYGGLFSVVLRSPAAARAFYDALPVAKGPSLGSNFTLACPYTILAHYTELEWAAQYDVAAHLVRCSVGLEDRAELLQAFQVAINAAEQATDSGAE